ncbi:hypothetical protein PENSPDRAFT_649971 [Peniophora sp. CONT]|nr:hypothetical protein PENSPDRAFT_649971 [Peniophora sp. CONT]
MPVAHLTTERAVTVGASPVNNASFDGHKLRKETRDRPYRCQHCGDLFARSDLLSRHVNKIHPNEKPLSSSAPQRRKGSTSATRATQACDQCVQSSLPGDGANPCSKCVHRKCPSPADDFQHRRLLAPTPYNVLMDSMGGKYTTDDILYPDQFGSLSLSPRPRFRETVAHELDGIFQGGGPEEPAGGRDYSASASTSGSYPFTSGYSPGIIVTNDRDTRRENPQPTPPKHPSRRRETQRRKTSSSHSGRKQLCPYCGADVHRPDMLKRHVDSTCPSAPGKKNGQDSRDMSWPGEGVF